MNAPIEYYESDYPSESLSRFPENFDETTELQGIRYDVEMYCEIAGDKPKRILELCCGTGRVAIPLARLGHRVTGVDNCTNMLRKFEQHLDTGDCAENATLVEADIVELNLEHKGFDFCLIPFNSLLLVTEFEKQRQALIRAYQHLRPGGEIIIDVVNPLLIPPGGDATPTPFFTRRHPVNGNIYTRFAARSPLDSHQRQRLFGWYDEMLDDGHVKRQHYEITWRPIFRFELQLMIEDAGFRIVDVEGGHRREPFASTSGHIFVRALKLTSP